MEQWQQINFLPVWGWSVFITSTIFPISCVQVKILQSKHQRDMCFRIIYHVWQVINSVNWRVFAGQWCSVVVYQVRAYIKIDSVISLSDSQIVLVSSVIVLIVFSRWKMVESSASRNRWLTILMRCVEKENWLLHSAKRQQQLCVKQGENLVNKSLWEWKCTQKSFA